MPDKFGITHEPHWGEVFHRCVECDAIPWGTKLSERERERHHRRHVNQRVHRLEQERMTNLRLARKTKRQIEKENA